MSIREEHEQTALEIIKQRLLERQREATGLHLCGALRGTTCPPKPRGAFSQDLGQPHEVRTGPAKGQLWGPSESVSQPCGEWVSQGPPWSSLEGVGMPRPCSLWPQWAR